MKLFGFGIIKNGVKFDYPFKESIRSMSSLVEKIYFNVGDCEDNTLEEIQKLNIELEGKIHILEKSWPQMSKGHVLSEMTNYALKNLESSTSDLKEAWGIYLQSDEVFSEKETEIILNDISKANSQGYDSIRFRYLHFWQNHQSIAINKNWYPHEIRAIKLNVGIESWGDAQGFRNQQKTFDSNCHVFHYGHVRTPKAYREKMHAMQSLYHSGEALEQKIKSFDEKDKSKEPTLSYFGHHPKVMHDRIRMLNEEPESPVIEGVNILGNVPKQLKNKIRTKKVIIIQKMSEAKPEYPTIILRPNLIQKILHPSKVGTKTRSKVCREWETDFYLTMKLSEKGVGME